MVVLASIAILHVETSAEANIKTPGDLYGGLLQPSPRGLRGSFSSDDQGSNFGGLLMAMGGWSFWRFYGRKCLVVHGTGERHEQNIGYGHPSRTAATPKRNRGYSEQTGYANPLCDIS